MAEKCKYINNYCYVCGVIVPHVNQQPQKKLISDKLKLLYSEYFKEPFVAGRDYTPDRVCKSCYNILLAWPDPESTKGSFAFVKPMQWTVDTEGHIPSRCYACMNFSGFSRKNLKNKEYKEFLTGKLPEPRPDGVDPPRPPSPSVFSAFQESGSSTTHGASVDDFDLDADYAPDDVMQPPKDDKVKLLTQSEMDYLVARFHLSQKDAENLTSFLKKRKMTEHGINSTAYRARQAEYAVYYTVENETFAYCNDIQGLMDEMDLEYDPTKRRLFIDGSTTSLKVVMLDITNKQPPIPLAYGIGMTECYETLEKIMNKIKYFEHNWKICCDLKVVNILQGIIKKGGYPKFFCYKCNWNSRYDGNHYQKRDWIDRDLVKERELKMVNPAIIPDHKNILMPPLHIKLGIAKKFIEVVVKNNDEVFKCLKEIFPKLSNVKIKAGDSN